MQDETPIVQHCRNCQAPLPEHSKYCPQCSQRNHDGKLTFREMMAESIGTLFNLDNRIFNTLRAMLVPGKLTTNYFEGKQIRYYHPVRLFIFTGLALASIIAVRFQQSDLYKKQEGIFDGNKAELTQKRFFANLDTARIAFNGDHPDAASVAAVDSFASRANFLHPVPVESDSSGISFRFFGQQKLSLKIANLDLVELSTDSLLTKYGIHESWDRYRLKQYLQMYKQPNGFILSLLGKAIWMLLLVVPLLALCLRLLYLRKPFVYYEHFVFVLDISSASFVLLFLNFIFKQSPPIWLTVVLVVLSMIYPFIAMRRVYKEGFWRTSLKYTLFTLAGVALGIVSLLLLLFASILLF